MLQQLRVASIPERHVYVRHIQPPADGWTVLPDPPGRPWWPPRRLDEAWIDRHHREFDVFHVHFGFDGLDPDALIKVGAALGRHGIPLVYTAHDLRNPHHDDPALHQAQMAALLAHADTVATLTSGAASELRSRHGTKAISVVPHPHVVPLDRMTTRRRQRLPRPATPRVGLHLKSLRPNVAAAEVLRALPEVVADVRCRLVVDVHTDVVEPGGHNHDPWVAAALAQLERRGVIDLHVHDFYDDSAFLDYLGSLDVSILPYRFGTHSGWLEACRDLDVAVVAPDCGHYAEQGATATFVCNEIDGLDSASLVAAVAAAATPERAAGFSVSWRAAQRADIAQAHRSLYEAAVTRRPLVGAS